MCRYKLKMFTLKHVSLKVRLRFMHFSLNIYLHHFHIKNTIVIYVHCHPCVTCHYNKFFMSNYIGYGEKSRVSAFL